MARNFAGASNQYLSATGSILGSPPTAAAYTVAFWFNADGTADEVMWGYAEPTDDKVDIYITSGGKLVAQDNAASVQAATSTTSYTPGTWHHACGVFASATSRTVYLDGGGKATNTNDCGTYRTAGYTFTVGTLLNPTPVFSFSGKIAAMATWSAALSDADVAQLAKGYHPILVQPQSLSNYWAMYGADNPVYDYYRSKNNLTLNNSPTKAETYPPIIYPARPAYIPGAVPVAASTARSFSVVIA